MTRAVSPLCETSAETHAEKRGMFANTGGKRTVCPWSVYKVLDGSTFQPQTSIPDRKSVFQMFFFFSELKCFAEATA